MKTEKQFLYFVGKVNMKKMFNCRNCFLLLCTFDSDNNMKTKYQLVQL